ncbi:cilia- and flagella-associated protein HOATZ isoform X2 [Ascaphus truei]|uniref:cilia- and flagella-associated protein HOATZ isoform X2 n=1 Tax=Ascaphus truei TaxID=8439 RepID=UPI003F5A322B
MAGTEDLSRYYTVFTGSSERDGICCKIFWNSVMLQPPLESRLVSGDMEQRLRAAGAPTLQTDYFILEGQKEQHLEQKAIYLQKAKRREEIIALLKKQREDRIKKEAISRAYKPQTTWAAPPSHDFEALEEIKAVEQLK